jgi:AcrR family transcriptional regulator
VRDRLLDAAATEISTIGTDRTSLRSIARTVGVSHQTPAHIFKNKTGVLTALAVRIIQTLGTEMNRVREAALASDADGKQIVTEIGVCYVHFAVGNPSLFGLAVHAELLNHTAPELRQALDTTWSVLTEAVRHAQTEGWRGDQPAETVATMCWSIVHGIASIHIARLHPTELQHRDTIDLMRKIADLL